MGKLSNQGWTKLTLSDNEKSHKPKTRFYQIQTEQIEQADKSLNIIGTMRSRTVDVETIDDLNKKIKTGHVYLMRVGAAYSLITPEEFLQNWSKLHAQSTKSTETEEKKLDCNAQSSDRLASVDALPENKTFSEIEFNNFTSNFKAKYTKNRFTPKRTEKGQITWTARGKVNKYDVAEVALYSKENKRSLHINTGTHGDRRGNHANQNPKLAEAKFTKQDINTVWNDQNISVHIVSTNAPALTTAQHEQIDIMHAWCFSDAWCYNTDANLKPHNNFKLEASNLVETTRDSYKSDNPNLAEKLDKLFDRIMNTEQRKPSQKSHSISSPSFNS